MTNSEIGIYLPNIGGNFEAKERSFDSRMIDSTDVYQIDTFCFNPVTEQGVSKGSVELERVLLDTNTNNFNKV